MHPLSQTWRHHENNGQGRTKRETPSDDLTYTERCWFACFSQLCLLYSRRWNLQDRELSGKARDAAANESSEEEEKSKSPGKVFLEENSRRRTVIHGYLIRSDFWGQTHREEKEGRRSREGIFGSLVFTEKEEEDDKIDYLHRYFLCCFSCKSGDINSW